jgi:hypothetical protein
VFGPRILLEVLPLLFGPFRFLTSLMSRNFLINALMFLLFTRVFGPFRFMANGRRVTVLNVNVFRFDIGLTKKMANPQESRSSNGDSRSVSKNGVSLVGRPHSFA